MRTPHAMSEIHRIVMIWRMGNIWGARPLRSKDVFEYALPSGHSGNVTVTLHDFRLMTITVQTVGDCGASGALRARSPFYLRIDTTDDVCNRFGADQIFFSNLQA